MRKRTLKYLCFIISALLIISALPITAYAESTVINVSTAEELSAALEEANTNGGKYTISLQADIGGSIYSNNPDTEITVIGNGHTLSGSPSLINVMNGTINLGDGNSELILQGDKTLREGQGLIYVYNSTSSTCNMYDKVTVKDNYVNNNYGAGVTVRLGTFHMYGGTIQNCQNLNGSVCYGGGVGVYQGGSFIMDGGTITECKAISSYQNSPSAWITGVGGGVFLTSGSSFIMNGGTISNNTSGYGGGIALDLCYIETRTSGGGYSKPLSTLKINGGKISGNTADLGGGIFTSGYYYCYSYGLGAYTPGSGTTDAPGIYVNGGEISGNTANEDGGGVFLIYLDPTSFKTQIHNAKILNNSAKCGAGVEVYANITTGDIDGCTITGNTATANGGGVALLGNSEGTTIKNSTIENNTSGEIGAGVYYDADSKLTISGKNTIQNNTFNGAANNLNVYSIDNPVIIGDALTDSQIGLSDPTLWNDNLEDTDANAVSTDYLTTGYKTNNGENIPSTYFTSDHNGWIVDYSDVNENEVRLVRRPPDYLETVKFTKTYKIKDGYDNEGDVLTTNGVLTENVAFTITPYKSFNREVGKTDIPSFTEESYTIPVGGTDPDELEVTLPDYTNYGIGDYWYEVKETAGSTAGVDYDSNTYYLHVVVSHEDVTNPSGCGISQITLHKTAPADDGSYTNEEADKTTGFTNEFASGNLKVEKKLTGNFADRDKTFNVDVVLTAPEGKTVTGPITYGTETISGNWTGTKTITLELQKGDSVEFTNIPDGVTYTVQETDYSSEGYDVPEYVFDNTTETGDVASSGTWTQAKAAGSISDSADTVTVKNNKTATIDVGVIVENTPFIILIMLVVGFGVFMLIRRRKRIDLD